MSYLFPTLIALAIAAYIVWAILSGINEHRRRKMLSEEERRLLDNEDQAILTESGRAAA
jgi:hypothetical protein